MSSRSRPAAGALHLGAALLDEGEDDLVGLAQLAVEAPQSRHPAQRPLQRRQHRQRALGEDQHLGEQVAQAVERRPLLQAEHHPQDDLERHALQARVQRDGLVGRPRGHLALGQLGHQPGETLHALAVEGRQQQAALLQVIVLVEQDDRVAPDQRLEDARALAGMQHVGRRGEHLLDVARVPQHHERRLERQPHGDPLAVRAQALQRRRGPRPRRHHLHRPGHRRPRGQLRSLAASHPCPPRSA